MRNTKNKEKRDIFYLLAILNILFLMAGILAFKTGNVPIALEVLFVNALLIFAAETAAAAFITFLSICYRWFRHNPSFGILETAFHLAFDKMRQNRALKNAQQIAPPLQAFLWQTLYRNKALLVGIDPGPDAGSLSPNGWRAVYRNGAVYYVFELVAPNEPEQDTNILQQLINQFIAAELTNYGIVGLAGFYGERQAVYLDRLTYDDVRHMLIFDVLYVASDKAAAALTKAWERDRPKAAAPEAEVYEDEL